MVLGRSLVMESLVWLISFPCEMRRENEREDERQDQGIKRKNVGGPSNPPDELAQNVSNKSLSDELFLHYFFESSESHRVLNYLHDSNSIFRAGRINSEIFSGGTVCSFSGAIALRTVLCWQHHAPDAQFSQRCLPSRTVWDQCHRHRVRDMRHGHVHQPRSFFGVYQMW